jgi:hypothetical protein
MGGKRHEVDPRALSKIAAKSLITLNVFCGLIRA